MFPFWFVYARSSNRSATRFVIEPEIWIWALPGTYVTPSGKASAMFTPVYVTVPVFATVTV